MPFFVCKAIIGGSHDCYHYYASYIEGAEGSVIVMEQILKSEESAERAAVLISP